MANSISTTDEYGNLWIMLRSTDKEGKKYIDEKLETGKDVYAMFVGTPPPPPGGGHP